MLRKDRKRWVEKDPLYPLEEWNTSPTYNTWLPISCIDILNLLPYRVVYGDKFAKDRKNRVPEPYFFRNFPINFVLVTGFCVSYERQQLKGSPRYVFEIDDGTGDAIECFYNTYTPFKDLKGSLLEIRGSLVDRPGNPRQVLVRNFRRLPKDKSPTEHFLNAAEECLNVRENLLVHGWKPNQTIQNTQDRLRNIDRSMGIPTQYCSFNRKPSIFHERDHHVSRTIVSMEEEEEKEKERLEQFMFDEQEAERELQAHLKKQELHWTRLEQEGAPTKVQTEHQANEQTD
uniref:ARAD1D45694p n=1 Tax=Blastobotrys adeninivorans TaxID=409370 RepID=A0A060TJA7_BLAAD